VRVYVPYCWVSSDGGMESLEWGVGAESGGMRRKMRAPGRRKDKTPTQQMATSLLTQPLLH
jgi:hypothetical protein